jgi:hypothetical protein
MKLNKMKISRLTDAQAKAVQGGYWGATKESTNKGFTCCWCTSEETKDDYTCKNTDVNAVNTCYQCPS